MQQRTVNYGVEPLAEDDPSGYRFRYKRITLEPGVWGYDALVSGLIRAEYPSDRMDAVVNNYLDNPTDPEVMAEMTEMQSWRKQAKGIAQKLL